MSGRNTARITSRRSSPSAPWQPEPPFATWAVIYFADTGARMGGSCALDERMLQELREQLGEKNVVVK